MKINKPYFHITTGDTDGVGLEVTLKSLINLKNELLVDYDFLIWVHPEQINHIRSCFQKDFALLNFSEINFSHSLPAQFTFLTDDASPALWFEKASLSCLNKNGAGIITAPLSKQETQKLGKDDLGHTDILKRICKIDLLFMAFIGSYFNTVLYSDHIPVKNIELHKERFKYFLDLALLLNSKFSDYDFKILGLNPHAGDQGLIGKEDLLIQEWIKEWNMSQALGPVPADSAFCDYQNQNPATYASLYHDQGLIPFKMAHGFSGYHTTLGLPFIRTSVDHGTAKELFGKDKADYTSMTDAILGAIKIHKGTAI